MNDQTRTDSTEKSGNRLATGKTTKAYWLPRMTKRNDLYGARIMFKGQRHYFTFTQDKHGSAKQAGNVYSRLLADG